MIKKIEWLIALKYLRTKEKEGFISVVSTFSLLGITLGVATLIIVMSVMSGYETQLIGRILGINGHLTVQLDDAQLQNFDSMTQEIKNIPHIRFAAPLINAQVMITYNGQAKGAFVRGMSAESLIQKPLMHQTLTQEAIDSFMRNEGIVIGREMAQELGISVGDYVKLVAPKVENLAFGMVPRIKTFKVISTFDVGMHEYNSSTIFMPMYFATIFFDYKHGANNLEIVLDHPEKLHSVKSAIESMSRYRYMSITDWTEANKSLVTALRIERNVMFFILSLIIVIAAFNIISSLIMLVQDKTRSIAILRTMGLARISILGIFMICGSLIGLVGTLAGTIIGVSFTLNIEKIRILLESATGYSLFDPVIYFLTSLPSELSIINTAVIITMSMALSFLSTIYPAWKASSIMPAVALRYE